MKPPTRWTAAALVATALGPLSASGCGDDRGDAGKATNRAPIGTNASGSGTMTTSGGGTGATDGGSVPSSTPTDGAGPGRAK